jgi:hypothetical protein
MYCISSVSLVVAGTNLTTYHLLLFIKISEINIIKSKGKDKTISLQAWTSPEGSRRLRLPDFKTAHEGGKVFSPTHRPLLSQEIFLVLISVRG